MIFLKKVSRNKEIAFWSIPFLLIILQINAGVFDRLGMFFWVWGALTCPFSWIAQHIYFKEHPEHDWRNHMSWENYLKTFELLFEPQMYPEQAREYYYLFLRGVLLLPIGVIALLIL